MASFNKVILVGNLTRDPELRYTPKISFRIDNSFDEAERVANLLNQERVQRDLNSDTPADDE